MRIIIVYAFYSLFFYINIYLDYCRWKRMVINHIFYAGLATGCLWFNQVHQSSWSLNCSDRFFLTYPQISFGAAVGWLTLTHSYIQVSQSANFLLPSIICRYSFLRFSNSKTFIVKGKRSTMLARNSNIESQNERKVCGLDFLCGLLFHCSLSWTHAAH